MTIAKRLHSNKLSTGTTVLRRNGGLFYSLSSRLSVVVSLWPLLSRCPPPVTVCACVCEIFNIRTRTVQISTEHTMYRSHIAILLIART